MYYEVFFFIALSSGVALFYEILKFISVEIERFPPSSQFFTCSVEILGQVNSNTISRTVSYKARPVLLLANRKVCVHVHYLYNLHGECPHFNVDYLHVHCTCTLQCRH